MSFLNTMAELKTNSAGQLLVNVLNYPNRSGSAVKPVPSNASPPVVDKHPKKIKITLKKRECRRLLAQWNKVSHKKNRIAVAELFSPPRFTKYIESKGGHGVAYNIKQGFDLTDPKVQQHADQELDRLCPELLVTCPPCTHRGGWEHLNRCYRSPLETAKLLKQARAQSQFCIRQIHKQLARGGDFFFEHPFPSEVWNDPEMVALKQKYGVRKIDMCIYDLKCPDSGEPIKKSTGLMLSFRPEDRGHALKTCSGCHSHRPVEGKLKDGRNGSEYVAEYTETFVKTISDLVIKQPQKHEVHWIDLTACETIECLAGESDEPMEAPPAEADKSVSTAESDDAAIDKALRRLHVNLGHPSNKDLVRILQHSHASSRAIAMAKELTCTVCGNHKQPASSLPAKVSRTWDFNDRIGLDVKYLPGWKTNQRVPCISIVDYATSLHVMAPIFTKENAELIKGVFRDTWITWAGPPKLLEMDPT